MRSLPLPTEEDCLRDHRERVPGHDWANLDGECKARQKESLITNQDEVCAYCEREIKLDTSHIDHHCPKGRSEFVHLTFNVGNLVASCGLHSGKTCGHAKGGEVLPVSLHPYEGGNLASFFRIRLDGTLVTTGEAPEGIEEAINEVLNLNEATLKEQRQTHIAVLRSYEGQEGLTNEEIAGLFREFPTLTALTLDLA